jgi:hypothetical protein
MEKISTTPLAHGNNNNFVGISSTNTATAASLNLQFDGLPKRSESSVRAAPSRANFRKSNTCGSLFAKCKCNNHVHHHTTVIPLITETDCDRSKLERNSRKTQSFSHPDTPVIFTEENRYPANGGGGDILGRLRTSQETIITTAGRQKVEIKHSKRASSPNLFINSNGIDIHPEFQVQVTSKNPTAAAAASPPDNSEISSSSPRSARRPLLKKASKSFPFPQRSSSFRSFDSIGDRTRSSSSYSVDETSEEIELSGKLQSDLLVSATTTTTVVDIHCSEHHQVNNGSSSVTDTSPTKFQSNEKPITDEKFLQVTHTITLSSAASTWLQFVFMLCLNKNCAWVDDRERERMHESIAFEEGEFSRILPRAARYVNDFYLIIICISNIYFLLYLLRFVMMME